MGDVFVVLPDLRQSPSLLSLVRLQSEGMTSHTLSHALKGEFSEVRPVYHFE